MNKLHLVRIFQLKYVTWTVDGTVIIRKDESYAYFMCFSGLHGRY